MNLFFAQIYIDTKQWSFAEDNIKNALKIYSHYSQKNKLAKAKYLEAKMWFEQNKLIEALNSAVEALNIANNYNLIDLKLQITLLISQIYEKQKNYSKALEFEKLYAIALKNYYEYKKTQRFSSLQMNLEILNKEKDLQLYKIKAQQTKLKIQKKLYKRNLIYGSIIGFLTLLLLIFFIIRNREKNKNEKLLKETNQLLKHEIFVRKKTENQMRENQARYKLLFKKMPIGIIQFNDNFIISDINEKITEIFNTDKNTIIGNPLNKIFDRNLMQNIDKFFNSNEEIFSTETKIVVSSKILFVELTIKKYKYSTDKGIVQGGIIIIEDLTEKKQTEQLLKSTFLLKEKIYKLLPDSIILATSSGEILQSHLPKNTDKENSITKLQELIPSNWSHKFFKYFDIVKEKKIIQRFIIDDKQQNYYIRIIPDLKENIFLIIIMELTKYGSRLIEQARQKKHLDKQAEYLRNIRYAIENELLGNFHNLQRGMSFIMLKNFTKKILNIADNFNNAELKKYGNELSEAINSFNVLKVNELLDYFPLLITQFIQEERYIL